MFICPSQMLSPTKRTLPHRNVTDNLYIEFLVYFRVMGNNRASNNLKKKNIMKTFKCICNYYFKKQLTYIMLKWFNKWIRYLILKHFRNSTPMVCNTFVLTTKSSIGIGTGKFFIHVGLLLIPSLIRIRTKMVVTEPTAATGLT